MGDVIIDWLVQNSFTILLFFLNIFWMIVFIRLRATLGPFLNQSLRVSFGMMKDPNLFIQFLNSKVAVFEWRSYNQVIKLDPEDPTTELVYVDRQNGQTPAVPNRKKESIFAFLGIGKKSSRDKSNEIYTDDFIPISLNPKKNYYFLGRQMHVIYEGQNITQNPLENFSQDAQVKKAGIAVEHQLIANKLLAESEFRNKMATKDDVKLYGLLNLAILGIGIVALIVMVIGLQGALDTFAKFAKETFAQYSPVIEALLKNVPRVVPG